MPEKPERFYFLDNLRSLVAIWVVVLHGAICYMEYPLAWYPVVDSQRSLFFTLLIMLVEPTLMTAMFFVSAFFALPSMASRGAGHFLKSKLLRIGVPWVLGVLVAVPLTDYLILLAREEPVGLAEFWFGKFWRDHYHQGAYWFLGVLLVLFLLFTVACRLMPGLLKRPAKPFIPSWWMLAGFWALVTGGMLAVQAMTGSARQSHVVFGYVVAVIPQRIPLYTSYFVLGLVAWRCRWFTSAGYHPRPLPWLILLLVSMGLSAVILGLGTDEHSLQTLARVLHLDLDSTALNAAPQMKLVLSVMGCAVGNAISLSALLGVGGLLQRRFNSPGPVQHSLAVNALGIYFIHPLVLYPIAYLFLGVTLPLALKFIVVVSLGLGLSWAASALILRRAPLLREIF